jgi:hypothetical protein
VNDIHDVLETVVSVAFLVSSFFVVALIAHWTGRKERETWKKFATANRLDFYPGNFLTGGTHIAGDYRQYSLRIETFYQDKTICTRVKLKANSPGPKQGEEIAWDSSTSPTPEDVLNLLAPTGPYGVYDGKIETMAWGESVWYWQAGALTYVDKMRRICNLLADLADRYPAVMSIGGTAVHSLEIIGRQNSQMFGVAVQMLRDIAHDTQKRLGPRAEHLICPRCLVRCGAHRADLPQQFDVTYYGCRLCRQSREFIDCPQGVVAVLDAGWADAQAQQDGLLRVNWLARRALFDFDQVEIIRAADKDVERFAVQVGNDTDPLRSPRYAEMGCAVGPACGLSENTLRVLESTFGQVQRIAV